MKVVSCVFDLFDPRKVIACYTIFIVVRSVKTNETQENVLLLSELSSEHIDCDFPLGLSAKENLTRIGFIDTDKTPIEEGFQKGL